MKYRITLNGKIPSKKNNWKPKAGGGIYCSKRDELGPLLLQVQSQWKREPLQRANISVCFSVKTLRRDMDNMYTTVQDLLVKGGVLRSDNINAVRDFRCFAAKAAEDVAVVDFWEPMA